MLPIVSHIYYIFIFIEHNCAMTDLPNVSSIFRDLSHLQATVKGTANDPNPYKNYSLEARRQPERGSFQQLYSYKQKRHEELMNKLRNSYQENRSLLQQGGQPMHQNYLEEKMYPSIVEKSLKRSSNTFIMPKIRYRHIEDSKKKEEKTVVENQLQREFYEDQNILKKNQKDINSEDLGIQTEMKHKGFESQLKQDSEVSFRTEKNFRAAKYEEKLSSYYDLCRKNIPTSHPQPKQTSQKFLRSDVPSKKPIRLDQALKILSQD